MKTRRGRGEPWNRKFTGEKKGTTMKSFSTNSVGWLGILAVAAVSATGCRTARHQQSAATTGLTAVHPGIHGRPPLDAGVQLKWTSLDRFTTSKVSMGSQVAQHAGAWAGTIWGNQGEFHTGTAEGAAIAFSAAIAGSITASLSGAIYGTVGHLLASPVKEVTPPSGIEPGQLVGRHLQLSMAPATQPANLGGLPRTGSLVLEMALRQEGLAQDDHSFRQFRFSVVVTGRLRNASGTKTYADFHVSERSDARPMSDWQSLTPSQWQDLVDDTEGRMVRRIEQALEDWLVGGSTMLADAGPESLP